MAEYEVLDNETGRTVTFEWNGDKDPTDDDMAEVFSAAKSNLPQDDATAAPTVSKAPSFLEQAWQGVKGAVELPMAVATGVTSYGVQKAAGLSKYLTGQGREAAEQAEQDWAQRLPAYQPTTNAAKEGMRYLGMIPESVGGLAKEAISLPAESWGVPKGAMYVPEMAAEIGSQVLIPKGVRATKAALRDNIVVDPLVKGAKATKETLYPAPSPEAALGQVLQGKSRDIPKNKDYRQGQKAFEAVNTRGAETYVDLYNRMDAAVKPYAEMVDEALMKDSTVSRLDDLATVQKTRGGAEVSTNHVATALENLEELYTKTNDPVKAANIKELRARAEEQGLTKKEVNDLAREYGYEFKAFNPSTGAPPTSISKQSYENTRSGLKEVARRGLDDSVKELDSTISAILDTRRLLEKNVEAANRLKQKVDERGLGEKIGRAALTAIDAVTMGTLKGAVLKMLPRGLGYKVKNFLDLEDSLTRNLKIINDEIGRVETGKKLKADYQVGPEFGPPPVASAEMQSYLGGDTSLPVTPFPGGPDAPRSPYNAPMMVDYQRASRPALPPPQKQLSYHEPNFEVVGNYPRGMGYEDLEAISGNVVKWRPKDTGIPKRLRDLREAVRLDEIKKAQDEAFYESIGGGIQ